MNGMRLQVGRNEVRCITCSLSFYFTSDPSPEQISPMSSMYSSSSSSSNVSSNASELSLATITSVSTNTTNLTASDLPGPGRNVGKLYGLAGRALERRFKIFVSKSKTKRSSGSSSTSTSLQAHAAPPTGPSTAISHLSISEP